MFITNNHASFHLWWKENLVKHWQVSKQYGQDCSSCWNNFCSGQKIFEEWKENHCISQETIEKLCTELRPYIQENKIRSRYPSLCCFFWAITDIVTVAIKTFQLKYANMFCFYFREVFPRVYLTKQHNYFTKRKSLRTCLFVVNQWKHETLYSVIY